MFRLQVKESDKKTTKKGTETWTEDAEVFGVRP
jgi:hypothetical protein